MSHNSHEGVSRRSIPTAAIATTTSSSPDEKTIPKNPNFSYNLSNVPPDSTPAYAEPPALTCPVPSCSLVFKGKSPHGYLLRHLRHPGIHRRTGDEKDSWLQLHKIEHDQLVA